MTGKNHFGEDANAAPGGLEMTPHNDVHVAVGGSRGLMVNPLTAAYDPIFWLHHSNVDRLWVEWLGLPDRENPAEPAWLDETFPFHDEEKNEVSSSAATVVDLSELGYEYEEVEVPAILAASAEEGSPMPTERPPDHPPELVGASAEPLSLYGQEERVPIELGQPSGPALLTDEGPVEPERVYVNVEGVEADENPGVVVRGLREPARRSGPGHGRPLPRRQPLVLRRRAGRRRGPRPPRSGPACATRSTSASS